MRFSYSSIIIASLLLVNNAEARWRPTPGMTWNYVLGDDSFNVNSEKAQVIDVDYNKSASTIQSYHNAGKKVICYFSGGTIEKHRKDYDQFTAVSGLVRNTYGDWPDERWLDIRKDGLKPLLLNRMKEAVSKNCDGIEVDNLDAWQQSEVKSWSDPLTKSDTISFAKWLANSAHELDIAIGLKNALFMIDEVGSYFDFAINESCATIPNPECHLYKNFLNQGKAVFAISYETRMSSENHLCSSLSGLSISMIIKKDQVLRQEGYIFDGKKQCGSDFKPGTVATISSTASTNTSASTISGNSNNPTKTTDKKDSNNDNGKKDNNNNNDKATKTLNDKSKDTAVNNAVNPNNANDNKSKEANPDGSSGNNDNKNNENNEGNILSHNKKGTIITGVAVTGIASAAGVVLLAKKNPRKYQNLKRSLSRKASTVSRKATTVKRKASSVTKKLIAKKKDKRQDYYYKYTSFNDEDALGNLNDNPFSTYRYQFTKKFDYY